MSSSSRDPGARGCFCFLFVGTNDFPVPVFIIMSNFSRSVVCRKLIVPRLVFIVTKTQDMGLKNENVNFVVTASFKY